MRTLGKLNGGGGWERRKRGNLWLRLEVGIVVAEGGPCPRSGAARDGHVLYRRLGIPLWILLTDYIGVQRRSGVDNILWILGRIRSS